MTKHHNNENNKNEFHSFKQTDKHTYATLKQQRKSTLFIQYPFFMLLYIKQKFHISDKRSFFIYLIFFFLLKEE